MEKKRWYIQTNVGIDGLKLYDKKIGINWKWQSMMDGAITKAPFGGGRKKSTGPNPTDIRSKSGTKRSLLVEGQGIPIGITIDGGANRHDMKMTRTTLQSIVIHRPLPSSSSSSL